LQFSKDILKLNCASESVRLEKFIRKQVYDNFRKKGIVIGISGGIDSALIAALSTKAIGAENVLGLLLPEKESNPVSTQYAETLLAQLRIPKEIVEITSILENFDVYRTRENIIKKQFPEFDNSWKFRLVMPQNLLEKDRYNISTLEVQDPQGNRHSRRLSAQEYLNMVAATDIKQRVRMTILYYYAEKNNYLVAGTTNYPETLQGFFVKYGDGGVDIEPIAHLYKTQVYQLAEYLHVPKEIINRTPSPDTYSLPVSDKELYYCLPMEQLDLLLYAKENNVSYEKIKEVLQLDDIQIDRVFRDFEAKQKATEHFRQLPPSLL